MSHFTAYVLTARGTKPSDAERAIQDSPANRRLGWGWRWGDLQPEVPTVAQALERLPPPESRHADVYSALVDRDGAIYRGYDFGDYRSAYATARHAILRHDRDGDWNLFADEPERCPPWVDFVRARLREHDGAVIILHGGD